MVQLFYINAGNVYEEVSIMYCPHVINHDDDSVNVRSGKFVLSRWRLKWQLWFHWCCCFDNLLAPHAVLQNVIEMDIQKKCEKRMSKMLPFDPIFQSHPLSCLLCSVDFIFHPKHWFCAGLLLLFLSHGIRWRVWGFIQTPAWMGYMDTCVFVILGDFVGEFVHV